MLQDGQYASCTFPTRGCMQTSMETVYWTTLLPTVTPPPPPPPFLPLLSVHPTVRLAAVSYSLSMQPSYKLKSLCPDKKVWFD